MNDDVQSFPLVGSIQNSVGAGFLGNQAAFAVANALGARLVHASSSFASAHGNVAGRSNAITDPADFRRQVAALVTTRPGIIHVGFLPKAAHVDVVASALREYKGVVLLDPVIGDHKKGLYVSEETARAIKEQLLPLAQIVTPNRFEADVLLGTDGRDRSEYGYLNGLFDLGAEAVMITSFEREPELRRSTTLFTNGYTYVRITGPHFPSYPAYGAGDVFASTVATIAGLGASPFAAALLATALTTRAVANATLYGGASVDPIAALAKWEPLGYHTDDDRAARFCERSNVATESIKPKMEEGPRLKFAPPKHHIVYG
jgi:pyridoxine kinase